MRNLVWIVLLLCSGPFCSSGEAQLPSRIYVNSLYGDVICTSARGERVMLKRLGEVPEGSVLQLNSGSTVTVVAQNNLYGEFAGPLRVAWDELRKSLHQPSGERERSLRNMLRLIWDRLIALAPSLSTDIVDTQNVGAVRGDAWQGGAVDLIPLSPCYGYVIGDSIRFSWFNGGYSKTQMVRIRDEDFVEVYKGEVTGSSVCIDVRNAGMKPGGLYTWSVTVPDAARKEASFRLADKRIAATAREQLQAAGAMAGRDEAGAHVMRALVYEDNQCLGNAYYEYAAAMAKDSSESVRSLYSAFLVNQLGLSRMAMESMLPPVEQSEKPASPADSLAPK
jgi:hypothetical protein